MSTATISHRPELSPNLADGALKVAARFWFVVAVAGQFLFAFTVASFYGLTAMRGNFYAWDKVLFRGLVAGNTMGNAALVGHILFATVISIAGALQLIPRLRNAYPTFHHWNGRLYLLAAFIQGTTGVFLTVSGKRIPGGRLQYVALWLSAALMILCAGMALRYALARNFKTHRVWALRLFLVASGSWFFRIGFFLTLAIFGPIGFDEATFSGPLPTFWSFAEYLLPLAVLELYLRAQDRPGLLRRVAATTVLFLLTLAMGAGIVVVTMGAWIPNIKAAFDTRKSIIEPLSAAISSNGIEAAVNRYRELKTAQPGVYNFDENELDSMGYQLLRAKKFGDAIRVFQLNVEAYPKSANVYDSLGEAYMDAGDKALAITNYQRSLQLNPKNSNAVKMLQKLNSPTFTAP